jgi:hypothetical protein
MGTRDRPHHLALRFMTCVENGNILLLLTYVRNTEVLTHRVWKQLRVIRLVRALDIDRTGMTRGLGVPCPPDTVFQIPAAELPPGDSGPALRRQSTCPPSPHGSALRWQSHARTESPLAAFHAGRSAQRRQSLRLTHFSFCKQLTNFRTAHVSRR